jgi:hypothetical protein
MKLTWTFRNKCKMKIILYAQCVPLEAVKTLSLNRLLLEWTMQKLCEVIMLSGSLCI